MSKSVDYQTTQLFSLEQAFADLDDEAQKALTENRKLRKILSDQSDQVEVILERARLLELEKKKLVATFLFYFYLRTNN